MLKDLNRPSIQFQGLKDKWVVKKLGEVGHFKNGMNISKDLMGYGYPFVNLQDAYLVNMKSITKNWVWFFQLINSKKNITYYKEMFYL